MRGAAVDPVIVGQPGAKQQTATDAIQVGQETGERLRDRDRVISEKRKAHSLDVDEVLMRVPVLRVAKGDAKQGAHVSPHWRACLQVGAWTEVEHLDAVDVSDGKLPCPRVVGDGDGAADQDASKSGAQSIGGEQRLDLPPLHGEEEGLVHAKSLWDPLDVGQQRQQQLDRVTRHALAFQASRCAHQ